MESLVLLVLVLSAVGADVNSNVPGVDTFGGVTSHRLEYIAADTLPSLESVPVLNTNGRHAVESSLLDHRVDEIIAFLGLYDDLRFERVMTSRVCVEYLQDMGAEYRKTLISLDLPVKPGVTALEPNDLKENQKILDVLRGLAPEDRITLIKAFDTRRLANVLVAGGAKVYEDHLFQGIIKGVITVFGAKDFQGMRRVSTPCMSNCTRIPDGGYQSCAGCTGFAPCFGGMPYERKCVGNTVRDDSAKSCQVTSSSCFDTYVSVSLVFNPFDFPQ